MSLDFHVYIRNKIKLKINHFLSARLNPIFNIYSSFSIKGENL